MAGLAIFSVLGNMCFLTGLDMDEIAEGGPGLAFVTYPRALSSLWCPPLWYEIIYFTEKQDSRYALFFGMILMLGIASQCAETESMITMLTDLKPKFFNRRPNRRSAFVFLVCLVCFCLALPMVTEVISIALNLILYYFRVVCTSSSYVIATEPMESRF